MTCVWARLLLCVTSLCVTSLCVGRTPTDGLYGYASELNYKKLGLDWPGLCQAGKAQSPINVITKDFVSIGNPTCMVKIESLGTVSGVNMFLTETLPHVEIEWEKFVSPPKVSVPATKDGDIFAAASGGSDPSELQHVAIEATQCHYHTPSEHTLDGKFFEGEVHCVHFVKDGESAKCDRIKAEGGLGCPVVLTIFLDAKRESELSPLHNLLLVTEAVSNALKIDQVPHSLGEKNGVKIEGDLDLNTFLPKSGEYATWPGSLTTFPCTEGVLWIKMLQPASVSPYQIALLQKSLGSAAGKDCKYVVGKQCIPPRTPFNHRLRQGLNGRVLRKGSAY